MLTALQHSITQTGFSFSSLARLRIQRQKKLFATKRGSNYGNQTDQDQLTREKYAIQLTINIELLPGIENLFSTQQTGMQCETYKEQLQSASPALKDPRCPRITQTAHKCAPCFMSPMEVLHRNEICTQVFRHITADHKAGLTCTGRIMAEVWM